MGSATYPNGDAYEGGFLKGDRHHQGKYTYSGGAPDPEGGEARPPRAVYEGLFERGVKSGVGEMTYADSSRRAALRKSLLMQSPRSTNPLLMPRYHGEFKDGLRGGSGTMYYASGDTYSGQWSGGLKQGEGTCVYSSGATLTGTWRGGMIEVGSFTDMHGSTFKGSFSGATTAPAYGEGTLTMPSGNAIPVAREGEFMSL